MNFLLSHILIFQVNERLNQKLPCLYRENTGLYKSRNSFLQEHLDALSFEEASEYLIDFGCPIQLTKFEYELVKWLATNLLISYLITSNDPSNNDYTSLHYVKTFQNCQSCCNCPQHKDFSSFFVEKILGSQLPLDQRKALMVSMISLGSSSFKQQGGC